MLTGKNPGADTDLDAEKSMLFDEFFCDQSENSEITVTFA